MSSSISCPLLFLRVLFVMTERFPCLSTCKTSMHAVTSWQKIPKWKTARRMTASLDSCPTKKKKKRQVTQQQSPGLSCCVLPFETTPWLLDTSPHPLLNFSGAFRRLASLHTHTHTRTQIAPLPQSVHVHLHRASSSHFSPHESSSVSSTPEPPRED